MSLIEEMRTACVLLDRQRAPDGAGGFITSWVEGAKFIANVHLNTTIEARVAEKQGVTGVYTVLTEKNAVLEYHDVFKRLYDEKIFRVTSDGSDKVTPKGAAMQMRLVTAEEYTLPTGETP